MPTKGETYPPLQSLDDRIDEKILAARRLFISDAIDNALAEEIIRKLWYLEFSNSKKPITVVINSPGGSIDAGLAIWDQMRMITSPITTLVTGIAASMGSILSLAAGHGRRFATPYSRIMIHQPALHGVIRGQATDLEIQAKEILKTRKIIVNIYVEATKKDYETIDKAIDRDMWMTPEEAKKFGLIDQIVDGLDKL